MTNYLSEIIKDFASICNLTEQILGAWETKNLKSLGVPDLLLMMTKEAGWNEKQLRQADPLVRFYLRSHPMWKISKGAKGGIMRREDGGVPKSTENASNELIEAPKSISAEVERII